MAIYQMLNNIFVDPPGDFIYFFMVITLSLASLFMAFQLRDEIENQEHSRYTLALTGVVFAWGLMLVGAIYSRVTNQNPDAILTPLERAVTTSCVLLLEWALVTSDHQQWRRASNMALLILLALVTAGYMLTGINWIALSGTIDFNLSNYGIAWAFITFILAILGILLLLLLFRRVVDAPLKIVFCTLIAVGAGITLYQITRGILIGDEAGIARLTFVLALILMPVQMFRRILAQHHRAIVEPRVPAQPIISRAPAPSHPRLSAVEMQSVQLLKALGMMMEVGAPAKIPPQVVRTTLDMLHADAGALLRLQDANYADITEAQDRMMNRKLAGLSLNLDNQPTLVNAIERKSQRALYPDRNREELEDIFTRLDIEQTGPVYYQPLVHNNEVVAVLLIAMPYTSRELRSEELEMLTSLGIVASSLLAISYEALETTRMAEDRIIQAMVEGVSPSTVQQSSVLAARQEMQDSLKLARDQITQLSKQVVQLKQELDHERNRVLGLFDDTVEGQSITQRITAITDEQQQLREEREQLMKRLQEAEAALNGATGADNESVLRNMIDALSTEKDKLLEEKQRLQLQLDDIRAQDKTLVPADMQHLLNRMMREKSLLESERSQLKDKLETIESQLRSLGIEGNSAGLSQLITQLFDDRTSLLSQNQMLKQERDALLHEREKLADNISHEKDRNTRIQALQLEIENLAADRETAVKQRDKGRSEIEDITEKLNVVKEHRARLLAQVSGYELELIEAREEQMQLRAQIQELADSRSELTHVRDNLLAENTTLTTEREQLMAQASGDPSRLQEVNEEGVGSLRSIIEDLSAERNRLERELNEAVTRVAEAERQVELAKITTADNSGQSYTYQPQQPDLLVGLVQELRTPMTSISGYIDLLLGESAGILGEMQRKFLQRVAANINRLDTMVDSLINITELDTGSYRLEPAPINIVNIVEEAITNASIQFREKGLAVTLDLDDSLPLLPADKDSMNQVIGQLLSNAYLVSPPDSEIIVTVSRRPVRLDKAAEPRICLYVSVEDHGGGIDSEDLPRVFLRKYRADNPLIEGLGDTGVGMSIAKALIEAHEGRLWLESKPGAGTTFSFAVPLDLIPEVKED